jgi:alkylhydroperoxidase family enzyme
MAATIRDVGLPAWGLSRLAGLIDGAGRIEVIEVFARNRRLFWGYLRFAIALVPLGRLPRADIELVTLRTAWNAGAHYAWAHHVVWSRLGRLGPLDLKRIAEGPGVTGWTERQAALLSATDELHAHRVISDTTWARLNEFLDQRQLVELCFLVGHYEMIGMCLNSFGVHPEDGIYRRGPLRRLHRDDPTT